MTEKLPADFDVVVPLAPEQDGKQRVARLRPEGAQPCVLVPAQNGQPIPAGGEFIRLRPRAGGRLADVEVVYGAKETASRSGPPKVVSDAYRQGWDEIFGRKGEEPN